MFSVHGNALVATPKGVTMQKNGPTVVAKVGQSVLAESLKIANGDPARLAIVDENTVIVYNSRESREYARNHAKRRRTPMAGRHKG